MSNLMSNKIISEISGKIFEHNHIVKFLYYTDKKYENESILNELKVSPSKVINKSLFINRRVPIPLEKAGAYMSIRLYDYNSGRKNQRFIKKLIVDIDVIVHQDCANTIHGSRDNVLVDYIQHAVCCKLPSSIGKCVIKSTYDILGLNVEYRGFTIRVSMDVFDE